MTNEEKQAALELCEGNILKLKGTIATFEAISPELDILLKLRSELIIQQAGLAALTAQPVKCPQLELVATLTLKDSEYEWERICYIPDGEHDLYIMKEGGE